MTSAALDSSKNCSQQLYHLVPSAETMVSAGIAAGAGFMTGNVIGAGAALLYMVQMKVAHRAVEFFFDNVSRDSSKNSKAFTGTKSALNLIAHAAVIGVTAPEGIAVGTVKGASGLIGGQLAYSVSDICMGKLGVKRESYLRRAVNFTSGTLMAASASSLAGKAIQYVHGIGETEKMAEDGLNKQHTEIDEAQVLENEFDAEDQFVDAFEDLETEVNYNDTVPEPYKWRASRNVDKNVTCTLNTSFTEVVNPLILYGNNGSCESFAVLSPKEHLSGYDTSLQQAQIMLSGYGRLEVYDFAGEQASVNMQQGYLHANHNALKSSEIIFHDGVLEAFEHSLLAVKMNVSIDDSLSHFHLHDFSAKNADINLDGGTIKAYQQSAQLTQVMMSHGNMNAYDQSLSSSAVVSESSYFSFRDAACRDCYVSLMKDSILGSRGTSLQNAVVTSHNSWIFLVGQSAKNASIMNDGENLSISDFAGENAAVMVKQGILTIMGNDAFEECINNRL